VLLRANRLELTLEHLVLDATRPYHDLFYDETRRLSRERLAMFPPPR
jgi:hypothetical protein